MTFRVLIIGGSGQVDNRWSITKEPTDKELDEVAKAYLERHGNYDTPDSTRLDEFPQARDLIGAPAQKHGEGRLGHATEVTNGDVLSWPEMKKAYAEKQADEKQGEPEKPPAPLAKYHIRRGLGENAPSLPGIIDKMGQDERFPEQR
jgi:hypothetical protein